MEVKYTIRNKQSGQVYIDNARSFGEAVEASKMIKSDDLEMEKTTKEIIHFFNNTPTKAE